MRAEVPCPTGAGGARRRAHVRFEGARRARRAGRAALLGLKGAGAARLARLRPACARNRVGGPDGALGGEALLAVVAGRALAPALGAGVIHEQPNVRARARVGAAVEVADGGVAVKQRRRPLPESAPQRDRRKVAERRRPHVAAEVGIERRPLRADDTSGCCVGLVVERRAVFGCAVAHKVGRGDLEARATSHVDGAAARQRGVVAEGRGVDGREAATHGDRPSIDRGAVAHKVAAAHAQRATEKQHRASVATRRAPRECQPHQPQRGVERHLKNAARAARVEHDGARAVLRLDRDCGERGVEAPEAAKRSDVVGATRQHEHALLARVRLRGDGEGGTQRAIVIAAVDEGAAGRCGSDVQLSSGRRRGRR